MLLMAAVTYALSVQSRSTRSAAFRESAFLSRRTEEGVNRAGF
jgi:hypothetical protein